MKALTDEFGLNPDELAEAERIIRSVPPGQYTLPKLYGSGWASIGSPTNFGSRFRASVDKRQLVGISLLPQKTAANHLQYLVHAR